MGLFQMSQVVNEDTLCTMDWIVLARIYNKKTAVK